MFFFHMFPSVLLYSRNVRVLSLVLDRHQTQTGASPCGQEEEDLVHCAAERDSASGSVYALMWPFLIALPYVLLISPRPGRFAAFPIK